MEGCYQRNKLCSCLSHETELDAAHSSYNRQFHSYHPYTPEPSRTPYERYYDTHAYQMKHNYHRLYTQLKRNEEYQFGWRDLQEVFTGSTHRGYYDRPLSRLHSRNGLPTAVTPDSHSIEEVKRKPCNASITITPSPCTCYIDDVIESHEERNKNHLRENIIKMRKKRNQTAFNIPSRLNKPHNLLKKAAPDVKRRRRKPQKPRDKPNQCLHLWEFLRDALKNPAIAPRFIMWTNQNEGEFRIVKTSAMAALWGQSKNRYKMTYEKMARAMRYYYKLKILEKVPSKRLHFRFSKQILNKINHMC